jgi:hypothetical protein
MLLLSHRNHAFARATDALQGAALGALSQVRVARIEWRLTVGAWVTRELEPTIFAHPLLTVARHAFDMYGAAYQANVLHLWDLANPCSFGAILRKQLLPKPKLDRCVCHSPRSIIQTRRRKRSNREVSRDNVRDAAQRFGNASECHVCFALEFAAAGLHEQGVVMLVQLKRRPCTRSRLSSRSSKQTLYLPFEHARPQSFATVCNRSPTLSNRSPRSAIVRQRAATVRNDQQPFVTISNRSPTRSNRSPTVSNRSLTLSNRS